MRRLTVVLVLLLIAIGAVAPIVTPVYAGNAHDGSYVMSSSAKMASMDCCSDPRDVMLHSQLSCAVDCHYIISLSEGLARAQFSLVSHSYFFSVKGGTGLQFLRPPISV